MVDRAGPSEAPPAWPPREAEPGQVSAVLVHLSDAKNSKRYGMDPASAVPPVAQNLYLLMWAAQRIGDPRKIELTVRAAPAQSVPAGAGEVRFTLAYDKDSSAAKQFEMDPACTEPPGASGLYLNFWVWNVLGQPARIEVTVRAAT
jgi:hypothetical protein